MIWLSANLGLIADISSLVGTFLGIPALVVALIQLQRTKKAAEAARESAKEALQRVSTVVAVATIEQMCSRSRDVLLSLRSRDLNGSARAAFELREAVAKFSKAKVAEHLQGEDAWFDLIKSVNRIHDNLEAAAAIRKMDTALRDKALQELGQIHSQLSMLSAVASETAGGVNADSKRLQ